MAGWSLYTTETKTAGTPISHMWECLGRAYKERADFAGLYFSHEVTYGTNLSKTNHLWFDGIMDTLIPKFGRMVGGEFVQYTVTSIYVELGETRIDSRVNYKGLPLPNHQWFEQNIRVINKLLFIKFERKVHYLLEYMTGGYYHGVADDFNTFLSITDAVEAAIGRAAYVENSGEQSWSDYKTIFHWTGANKYYDPRIFYFGTAVSSNYSYRIRPYNGAWANTTHTLSIYTIVYPPNGGFDGGGLWVEGENCILSNISVAFDALGWGQLPPIPGEGSNNFPKYPGNEHGTEYGYVFDRYFYLIEHPGGIESGNFKFIAGS